MIASADYSRGRDRCMEVSNKIVKTIDTLNNVGTSGASLVINIPFIIFASFKQAWVSQSVLKEVKNILEKCTQDCTGLENEASCMVLLLEGATQIRNNFSSMLESISEFKLMYFFLGRLTEKTLSDWDDLVEGLTISSDPEIRSLIHDISEVACR